MALKNRKRINSTLTSDNFDFIVELADKTNFNQSKFYDLSVELLRRELETKSIYKLLEEIEEGK